METKIKEFCQYLEHTKIDRKDFFKTLGIFSLVLLSNTMPAYAHPPSDITLAFDKNTKVLKAVITHQVNNPNRHFIYKIELGLNGQEILTHKISRQDNNINQTVSYLIPDIKSGDVVSIGAYCNISGRLRKEIRIE